MVSARKVRIKRILIIIITVLIALSAISMIATKVVYDSIFARYDSAADIPDELADTVIAREEHSYYSGENRLQGYLYRSDAAVKRNALIVIATGINSESDDYLWQTRSLLDCGWSVFIFDATGCGASNGKSAVGFSQILLDLNETICYIESKECFGYNDMVLLGHSRGGYAACCALQYEHDIAAVVSISGQNSAMEGVIGSSTQYVGPLAYGNFGGLWLYQTMLFGGDVISLEADEVIGASDVPVLIVHGQEDEITPLDRYSVMAHKDEIKSARVEYIVCADDGQSGHTSLMFDASGRANSRLMAQIDDFLTRSIG